MLHSCSGAGGQRHFLTRSTQKCSSLQETYHTHCCHSESGLMSPWQSHLSAAGYQRIISSIFCGHKEVFSPLAAPFLIQCHSEKLLCGHSLLIKSLVKLCTALIFKAVHEMKKEYLPAQCIPRSL